MEIIDTHCDALYKLQIAKRNACQEGTLDYRSSEEIDTNFKRLQRGEVIVQFYAIFIPPEVPSDEMWQHALEQIDLFHAEILAKNPEIKQIKNWKDLDTLKPGEIGAVLALEGADPIGNDLVKLRHLYRLGILSIGLTWNYANLCADGIKEPRAGGLTLLGKEVVKQNNKHQVFTDVSHSTVQGFWDIVEYAEYPIATHSNTWSRCNHPRNLNDEQIKAMIKKDGLIQVVFHPPFTKETEDHVSIKHLIQHIDHLCSLGGVKNIGFGSDFDGIVKKIINLEHAGKYQNLIDELLKYYSEEEVKGFAYQNFLNHRPGLK